MTNTYRYDWHDSACDKGESTGLGGEPMSWPCNCEMPRLLEVAFDDGAREAERTIARLTRERDAAIAHDRQPYPTAWAYEKLAETHEKLRAAYREIADRLEAALAPDGTHRIIEGGYCLDCQGGCMRDFVNTPEPVAYVEPSPFHAPYLCRCGRSAYRPDSVTGRRQALRCRACHHTTGRCSCVKTAVAS